MKEKKNIKKHIITFRATSEELAELKQKMKKVGTTNRTEFLKACVFNRSVRVVKIDRSKLMVFGQLGELKEELAAIGRNVNQAVKVIHTQAKKGRITSERFVEINDELKQGLETLDEYKDKIEGITDKIY